MVWLTVTRCHEVSPVSGCRVVWKRLSQKPEAVRCVSAASQLPRPSCLCLLRPVAFGSGSLMLRKWQAGQSVPREPV